MISIPIFAEDIERAATSLERLQHKRGAPRTLELAAAQIRADVDYLAQWVGPAAAADALEQEARRVITEAAAELAAPEPDPSYPLERRRRRHLVTAGRAAAWSIGIFTGFVLGLGVSALA
jgi:hypothetical protein